MQNTTSHGHNTRDWVENLIYTFQGKIKVRCHEQYEHLQPKQSGSIFSSAEGLFRSTTPASVGMYMQAQLPRDTWQSESE